MRIPSGVLNVTLACYLALAGVICGETIQALYSVGISYDSKDVTGSSIVRDVGRFRVQTAFEYGAATDSAEIDAAFSVRGEVSSSTAAAHDLGALTDYRGVALAFSRVKSAAVKNLSPDRTLTVGGEANSFAFGQATPTSFVVPPLGAWSMAAPYEGLDASLTARIVDIVSDGGVASYDLVILGVRK